MASVRAAAEVEPLGQGDLDLAPVDPTQLEVVGGRVRRGAELHLAEERGVVGDGGEVQGAVQGLGP